MNKEEINKYYNYIYLDPTKPGIFPIKGINIILKFEPFYVGKGTGKRIEQHKYNSSGKFMKSKLTLLNILNIKPIKYKILKNISNFEACENEKYLIKTIGRRDLGLGTLVNLTNGGEEGYGYIQSIETREKRGNKLRNIPLKEEHKIKIGISNKGKVPSDNTKLGLKLLRENTNFITHYREILEFDLDGNLINEYKSVIEASIKTNNSRSFIIKRCKNINLLYRFNKTIFKYKNDK